MRALGFVLVFTFVALYAPRAALGNGRFPKAQVIETVPAGDGRTVYLRATFGVLLSRDGGKSWRWICEQAYGTPSTWDPPLAIMRDGQLFLGLAAGMRVTDGGCEVRDVPAFASETVVDLATSALGQWLYAATSTSGKPSFVWRRDEAGNWERRAAIPGVRIDTLEVAPSRPTRLYVTGVGEHNKARFFRSDDGGRSFTEKAPALPHEGRLYVASVDPDDPDRLLVRALHDAGSDLLLSTDGGATVRAVLAMKGAMFGFARSDDGKNVWAGSGDPAEGISRSADRGEHWEPAAKASIFCLHADGPRLFACGNPYTRGGFAAAVSLDLGATLTPLSTFDDILGPVTCDGGEGRRCEAAWPETRAALAVAAPPAASASSAPGTSASPVPSITASGSWSTSRSCGCTEVRSEPTGAAWVAVGVAVGAVAHRRRRRRA